MKVLNIKINQVLLCLKFKMNAFRIVLIIVFGQLISISLQNKKILVLLIIL